MTEIDTGLKRTQEKASSLDEVNKTLDSILIELRRDLSLEEKKALTIKANGLLYGVIYNYPYLAHSVEVRLGREAYENSERIDDLCGESNRWWYKRLVGNRKKQGESDPYSLVVPLPYGFTTGTHGSGERAAISASRREVYFDLTNRRGKYEYDNPCLRVTVQAPLVFSHETTFLPEEIDKVSLSGRIDLSPYLGHDRDEVESRGNYIYNYLDFRGFENRGIGKYIKKDSKPIILTSQQDYGLWSYDWQKRKLIKGFFVSYDRADLEKTIMYEVNNQALSNQYDEDVIGTMIDKVLSRVNQPNKKFSFPFSRSESNTIAYTGNEILKRLVKIPVSERHF